MATLRLIPPVRYGDARFAFGGLVLFVVLVYSNPGNLFFADTADVGIAKMAAAVAMVALGLSALLRDRPLHVGGFVGVLVLGYFAWVGASASWSLWPALTIETLIDGVKYLAIFLLTANVIDGAKRAARLVHAIAFSSVIPAVGAIYSWSRGEHLVEGDRAGWIGIFGNPNDLAFHLVIGIALALGGRELARRTWVKGAYLVGIALMAVAVLLSQSRGGLIAAGTVLVLWGVRGFSRGRGLIGVVAILGVAIAYAPSATWQRAETTLEYERDASAQGRIDAWRTGVNVLKGRPLTGVGAGAFALAWPEFAPGDAGPPRSSHNTFVQIVAETGLPALLLFGGALAAAVFGLTRLARATRTPDRATVAILARTVQVALGGFCVASLTGGHAYAWPLYLLLGLAAALVREAAPPYEEAPLRSVREATA